MASLPTYRPSRIGRYDVTGLLATGGMAELFLARQTGPSGFDRPVVIKRVLPHLAREPGFRDMFLDEARLVVNIRNPNVVQVHELGDDGTQLFLVMEYLEGESLAALSKELSRTGERLSPRVAAYVLSEACIGLHAAHELKVGDRSLGLVHRDVSPHNLFVLYAGQIKVIDFGIAKATDRASKTQTGTVKGKAAYMAPEQVRAEDVDRRADVFSLGVVLHELLTGRSLFGRAHEFLVMQAVCLEPIPRPSELADGIDPGLESIAMRALSRAADERYATAADMRRELVAALARLSVGREGELVEEELARVMQSRFAERIAAKAAMLQKVSSGEELTSVVGEIVPTPASAASGTAQASPPQVLSVAPTFARAPRRWPLAVGVGVALAAGVGLGIGLSRGDGAASSSDAPQSAPAALTSAGPAELAQSASAPTVSPAAQTSSAAESAALPTASVSAAATQGPARVARPPTRPPPAAPTSKPTGGFGRFD